jgi:O-antigen ligase
MLTRPARSALCAVALAAAAAPSLLAYNLPPSPTLLNQVLACLLWGVFVACCGLQQHPSTQVRPALLALFLLAAGVAASFAWQGLPSPLALSAFGLLAACAVLLLAGSAARAGPQSLLLFALFCWGWVGAGLLNLGVAVVQVFLPAWADGHWVAVSASPGRAIGNLRQPNHLSSLFMWAGVAVAGLLVMRRLRLRWAALLMLALVFGVVLTASRTGCLSVALLALWGLLDRRLPRPTRLLLMAAPLMYALSWWSLSKWAALSDSAFGAEQRLAEADISGSRFAIWANTWQLIVQQPWTGVGFGNFNLAWTLTPFAHRPAAFFDHSHNLPLQLAAELGVPMAATVMGLLLWALLGAWRRAWRQTRAESPTENGSLQRCALMMFVMIGLHSLLEYPLWYAYFLLPAGWALGFGLGADPATPALAAQTTPDVLMARDRRPSRLGGATVAAAAVVLVLCAAAAVADYKRVVVIYTATTKYGPLSERIKRGQRSLLFGHQADYAAATSALRGPQINPAFERATRNLLDTRLMVAWARALADQGDVDRARHLAARIREFRKAEATNLFATCPESTHTVVAEAAAVKAGGTGAAENDGMPDEDSPAYACERPVASWNWREFMKYKR